MCQQLIIFVSRPYLFAQSQLIMNQCQQTVYLKRLRQEGICSGLIAGIHILRIVISGQQNKRDMTDIQVSLHFPAKLKPIHTGHHNITDYDIRQSVLNLFQSFFTILSDIYTNKVMAQCFFQITSQFGSIFYHHHRIFL